MNGNVMDNKYNIEEMDGCLYLIFEWKSEDYIFGKKNQVNIFCKKNNNILSVV